MATIIILGGTGYTGSNLVHEAVRRGHKVISYSRNEPVEKVDGVEYRIASLADDTARQSAVAGTDVVIGTLAPRGELEAELASIYTRITELAATNGVRLGIVGGFSTLRPAENAPRFVEGTDIPAEYAAEATVMYTVLRSLEDEAPEDLDWVYFSPAQQFGAYAPGEATGNYRVGGQVALFDATGSSAISGADFAKAIIDEIETPAHHREQISIAY